MNVSRIAILGFALVAGVGAFFLMMSGRDVPQPIAPVQMTQEETTRVLVASRDMGRGHRLTDEDSKWQVWPKKDIPPNFITEENTAAREALQSAVARGLIVAGEPIVEAKIIRAGDASLMAALLSPGMRAVTLRISPETASGGFILPGDRVDLMHTINGGTRMIFENVRVLAINTSYIEGGEAANLAGNNMTLELSPQDSELFLSKRSSGAFSVVLRSIFKPEGEVAGNKRRTNVNIIRYGRS